MPARLQAWRPRQLTAWERFKQQPAAFLARCIHRYKPQLTHAAPEDPIITVVCLSDTHETQPEVPDGDLLLHAGDLTNGGSFEALQAQIDWLASLPHMHKVVIAGNHDRILDAEYVARSFDPAFDREGKSLGDLEWHDLIYLNNTSRALEFANGRKLAIYGSPWTPDCGNFAFQYPPIRDVWHGLTPDDMDILLTHGPPRGYLDLEKGCPHLTREIARTRPRMVVFGHIHAGRGAQQVRHDNLERNYQKIMAGDSGTIACAGMALWLVISWAARALTFLLGIHHDHVARDHTTMINAAVVGGPRNEEGHSPTVMGI